MQRDAIEEINVLLVRLRLEQEAMRKQIATQKELLLESVDREKALKAKIASLETGRGGIDPEVHATLKRERDAMFDKLTRARSTSGGSPPANKKQKK